MRDVFRDLLNKNVEIRIITNSIVSDDSLLAYAGYRAMKKDLIALGIELYEYRGPETAHAKVAVIDGKISVVGSFNLDPRSAEINREVGVAITETEDGEFAKTLTLAIEELRTNSILVGKEGRPQNLDLQKQEEKKVSVGKRLYLKILRLFLPLYRKQI